MADESNPHLALTERFGEAVAYAAHLHRDQARKDTSVPYVAHLLGAASFVLEQDGTSEDQAIAALLHDAIEDQPDRTSSEEIARRFGDAVARIVEDCTDANTHPKPPWRHRKAAYLAHLETVQVRSLQVSLADKLHNARAIATDVEVHGPSVWSRFNAPPVAQRWYYESLSGVFGRRLDSPLATAFAATVERAVGGLPASVDLPDGVDRPEWVGDHSITAAAASLEEAERQVGGSLGAAGASAWTDAGGDWWVEAVDAGDPHRPLTLFVRTV